MMSDGNKRAKMVLQLNEQYGKVLTALLIGNTVLNIVISTIGAIIFTNYFITQVNCNITNSYFYFT